MAVRITDLTTASAIEADDYVVIDGATEGTRKVLVKDVGGEELIDFTTSYTSASVDARGVSGNLYVITPVDTNNVTAINALKISAYLLGTSNYIYPLIIPQVQLNGTSSFTAYVKSIQTNVQNTSAAYVTGALHFVAPFEISTVSLTM